MAAVRKAPHYPVPFPAVPVPARATAALLLALLAGCGGGPAVRPAAPAARDWPRTAPADPASANAVTLRALSLVGTPYRYGGNTPDSGFDCSGLVNYVYRDMLDLRLPRSSRELAALQGPRLAQDRLATGDLVFFGRGGDVSHVGIYVGEGRFVHAPSSGGTVRLDRLDGAYWRDHYTGARRVLR
ncbi:C40 family peptidase [Pseudoxanthomonas broegbernensis]|uniref:C40 family peptidase n=1 Tax=Pseudoxanthomonas broegbernensis TaxID=83619 RepID=UPI00161B0E63|nr:C40 family peptidase [Pseudoxanthomonas broegbernensis]